jgi:hypothetical protein
VDAHARTGLANITGPGAEPSLVWWLGSLRGWHKTDEVVFGSIPVFAGLSDGPYETESLQSKLIGRIVGVALSPLDRLITETAGYENEEAGNAAFDPGEYLDALIAAGYGPSVQGNWYFEAMPDKTLPYTHPLEKAVLAVRWKFMEASTAVERVKQECIRRGLIERSAA